MADRAFARRLRPAIGLALAVATCAHGAGIGAAARAFPDTRARTGVFADQLPAQLSTAQWRFVATHYAGTQKMTRRWAEHIRRLNPRFLILHYQLAVGTGPAAFLDRNAWTNDFPQVTKHEDWFLHDAGGHRLLQPAWDWYLMDVRFRGGRPTTGFPAYWVYSAITRMRDNEDDGCFADSYTQDILMNQLRPPFRWFTSADANRRFWLPQLNQYGAYCATRLHAQPERFYYLPNLGGLVTTWDRYTNLAVGDGGMCEGFCQPGSGRYYSEDDWKLQMSHLLSLAGRGKILLCQTGIDPRDSNQRWFIAGSYLLAKGRHSFLNMIHQGSLEWYPEYDVNLGPYCARPAGDVSAYWHAPWSVYRRDYQRGFVLVNPSAAPVAVHIQEAGCRVLTATGGGPIGTDGRATGSLSESPVATLVIPAHSARVVLRPPARSGSAPGVAASLGPASRRPLVPHRRRSAE